MVEKQVLVVGLGEVGRPLYELLKEWGKFLVYGFDVDEGKMSSIGQRGVPDEVDIIHVCVPCFSQDKFVNIVVSYAKRFKPKLLIIVQSRLEQRRRSMNCVAVLLPILLFAECTKVWSI